MYRTIAGGGMIGLLAGTLLMDSLGYNSPGLNLLGFIGVLLYPVGLSLIGSDSYEPDDFSEFGLEIPIGLFSVFLYYYNILILTQLPDNLVFDIIVSLFLLDFGTLIITAPAFGRSLTHHYFYLEVKTK